MSKSAFEKTKDIISDIELINKICFATCNQGCAIRANHQELCLSLPAAASADDFIPAMHDFLTSRGWSFYEDAGEWTLTL